MAANPKDPNPMASPGMPRPRLASVPLPEAQPTPRAIDYSRVTTPEDQAAGDPDWIAGRLLADRAYFETKIGKLEAVIEVMEANVAMMQVQMTDMQKSLGSVLALIPTDREKRLALWLAGIVVTAVCAKFGIDLGAFK